MHAVRSQRRFARAARVVRGVLGGLGLVGVVWLAWTGFLAGRGGLDVRPAAAQETVTQAPPPPERAEVDPIEVAADSPRASVETFLRLAHAEDWARAGELVEPPTGIARADAARHVAAVVIQEMAVDAFSLSPASGGRTDDALPAGVDEIGRLRMKDGTIVGVRVAYRRGPPPRWVFTRESVANLETRYQTLPNRWVLEHFPPWLLADGPYGLSLWHWIALPLLFVVALLVGRLLSALTRWVFGHVAVRTSWSWDDDLIKRLGGPIALAWTLGFVYASLPWLGLPQKVDAFLSGAMGAGLVFAFFWTVQRFVEVGGNLIERSAWATTHPGGRGLVPLGVRVAKVAVFLLGLVAMMSQLGFPVASLIAGLGIGGLAVALAGQKTIENLFGAFSLGFDQPFVQGDFVKVEDFVATVEAVGLRSTRFRTLDRTLITIPNSKVAEARIESYTARDRIRLACFLGLEYQTSGAQMRQVLEGFRTHLREHPKIWPDSIMVRFARFADSSMDIEVMAWFLTQDWNEFVAIREEVFLAFMDIVREAGTSFAYPTRTVWLKSDEEARGPLARLTAAAEAPPPRPPEEGPGERPGDLSP